ncbi:ATP-binding cassette domain-containing protein [Clostridium combesii]|uniref:Tungsten ABC transporter ATP-binding protein n=1 Tax=Clostridium combesii TaxID=39481 RepID=A0A2G7HLI9_9CLOT|nr:ATP-binding cassette domain-containing protein [Clostridium combesii]PIH05556.1 tungsten ABC transporter ATP-binding protein [Clostridium combesii]
MKIEVVNAVKEYAGRKVLDIEHMVFKERSIYGILGLNGSGKSTLLQSIAGFNKLNEGEIIYDGKDFNKVKDKISMMTQRPLLFNCSAGENIIMGLKFRKTPRRTVDARFEKYIKYFNINEILNKNGKKLSGGETQKVALLRTVILESDVIILDEPTASMDIESTLASETLIKDIMEDKRTVIFVTHDFYQAERIADYVIFMDKGKIIEQGETDNIFNNPKNAKVKMMLNK